MSYFRKQVERELRHEASSEFRISRALNKAHILPVDAKRAREQGRHEIRVELREMEG